MTDKCRVVMLFGHPASGKSTAATKIMQALPNAEIVSSAKIRLRGNRHGSTAAFVDEDNPETRMVKDWAYQQLCQKAEQLLLDGKTPILDATFHRRYRRRWAYGIARKRKAEVYVVWVQNDENNAGIMKRRSRKKAALHTTEQYQTMVSQTEKLEGRELLLKTIKFNRAKNKVKLYNCGKDAFARKIAKAIKTRIKRS